MSTTFITTQQKIEIPVMEYNLLKEVYNQFRKQTLLLRIIDAEENLKKGKVKKLGITEFIKGI